MKKAACLSLVVVVALGASGVRAGEVDVKGHPTVTFGGEFDLRGIFRNDNLMKLYFGVLRVPSGAAASHSDFFVDPDFTLNMDIENPATPIWRARLSLKTPQYIVDDFGSILRNVSIREAYVALPEIVFKPLTLTAGIMDYSTDVRKNGQSFLFHPYESESAFQRRFGNVAPVFVSPLAGNGFVGSTGTSASTLAFADGVGPGSSTGEANTLETAGLLAKFEKSNFGLEGFYFSLLEGRDLAGGDEVAFGGIASYDLQERGRVQALYIAFENDSSSRIHNLGLGASYLALLDENLGELEAYGEVVYQFGNYATNVPDVGFRNLHQDSTAFYGGIRYLFKMLNVKPGVDVSYWFIGGDNTTSSNTNNDFVSYENIDDTLIVEENDYGLDIDTNYEALKVRFRLGWDINDEDELDEDFVVSVLYAYFQLEQTQPGPEKIGDEIDVSLLWNYSPNLSFFGAAGWLFDMKAFNQAGAPGSPDGNDLSMVTFGTRLKF